MKRTTWFQRTGSTALGVMMAALLLAVALPHRHDGGGVSHHHESCRLCKINEGFLAVPAIPTAVRPMLAFVAMDAALPRHLPRTLLAVRLPPPRAPPVSC